MKIKKSQPVPGVVYLKFNNQYDTCSTFMRLQEFYESPFKKVRGQFFTLEQFMDLYAKQQGNFTYTTDWGGFNVPGHVVDAFFSKFGHDLLEKEKLLQEQIYEVDGMGNLVPPENKYYVIGMCDEYCLEHELCHAVYYLNDEYRQLANKMVKALPKFVSETIKTWLLKKGYSKPLVVDETNAYLSTSEQYELTRNFGRVGSRFEKFAPFREAFAKFRAA